MENQVNKTSGVRRYWFHAIMGLIIPLPLGGIISLAFTPFESYLHSDVLFYLPIILSVIIPAVVIYYVERGHDYVFRKILVFLCTTLVVFGAIGVLLYAAAGGF